MGRRFLLFAVLSLAALVQAGCFWCHRHCHCRKPPVAAEATETLIPPPRGAP